MAGEIPIVGEQKQPFGVVVEPPNRNQAREPLGQSLENGGPSLRVLVRGDAALGLVIAPKPGRLARSKRPAVDQHLVRGQHVECRAIDSGTVHGHAPFLDQRLGLAPGAEPRAGDHLGDALGAGFAVMQIFVWCHHGSGQQSRL